MYSDLRYIAVFLAGVAAALIVLRLARRRAACPLSLAQRNLFSTNFGFFTTLYTFFLGFAVVSLWQTYNGADTAITDETDLLVVECRLSQSLPDSDGFRRALLRYTEAVREPGWAKMRDGEASDGAGALYDAVWDELRALAPAPDSHVQAIYTLMLSRLIDCNKLRHQRLLLIDGSLYTPIWVIIYLGVAFTLIGFYFIETGNKPADRFFIAMMLTMLIGNIFLLYELDTPFSGVICLDPDKFAQAAQTIRGLSGL